MGVCFKGWIDFGERFFGAFAFGILEGVGGRGGGVRGTGGTVCVLIGGGGEHASGREAVVSVKRKRISKSVGRHCRVVEGGFHRQKASGCERGRISIDIRQANGSQ